MLANEPGETWRAQNRQGYSCHVAKLWGHEAMKLTSDLVDATDLGPLLHHTALSFSCSNSSA